MIEAIMSTLSSVVESFGGVLGKVFTGITSIFYILIMSFDDFLYNFK